MPADEQQYWKSPSIYKVPPFITDLKSKAYQPQVVSFGPYHYRDDCLSSMEEHKHRVLLHFLKRSKKTIELFFESLSKKARELKDSYDKLDPTWNEGAGGQFLKLMIMDGCFMLEIMRNTVGEKRDYAHNDPIFNIQRLKYIAPYIGRDMLLMENQLPMLVLYELVKVESDGKEDDVNELIRKFYFPHEKKKFTGTCLHVLDVFRKGLLMKPEHERKKVELESIEEMVNSAAKDNRQATDLNKTELIIRSATELNEAGIRFKKSKTNSLEDIFFAGGELELPLITVDDTTESKFLNAMTFERLHSGAWNEDAGNEVTSYVTFMDKIINDEQDVALLHTRGIIQNDFGSDKAVAELFNSLCTEVTLPSNSSLEFVQRKICLHCELPWNRWRANLNRTYFKNPWTILSLVAAIFLFVLTIIQAVFAVLSYH
ncbi:hypothetical protein BT93_A0758 [Corymbia citriodora subsp. variegata]|nr:hypothetical protein BT93_A0758 [Corymbia citriodora subsp. variegata]